jgi:hypothetical protein
MRATIFGLIVTAQRRRMRGTIDFAAIPDRDRMPWRFLARHMAVDGRTAG